MRLALASLLIVSGCGKQLNDEFCYAHPDDTRCVTAADAAGGGDGRADAGVVSATQMYVSTNDGDLYGLRVGTMQATLLGHLEDPDAPGTALPADGLGFMPDGTLVGVTASDFLLTIDPTTGTVTSKVALAAAHDYWGLVVLPPGGLGPDAAILVAASDQHLYEARLDGSVRDIGSFGGGLAVAGDLAWVPGVGLFSSVTGTGCSGACIARVSPTTGQATLLSTSGPSDLWALSGYANQLWAIGGTDLAYTVDKITGAVVPAFSTGIPNVSDAAP